MLRIALAQINTTVGDFSGNCRKIMDSVSRAKAMRADVVVFPELAVTGYPPEDLLYKEHFVRDNLVIVRSLAKKIQGIVAIVGFVDSDAKKNLYNAAAVISNWKIKGVYHKHALPNYGVFDEKRYFKEGTNGSLYLIGNIPVGLSICEDFWVDDGVHQAQARAGAKVLINLSSSPYDCEKLQARKKLLVSRAKKEKVFVCYTNLFGGQDELVFDGGSFVVDPQGQVIASGKEFNEDLVVVDLPVSGVKANFSKKFVPIAVPEDVKIKKSLLPHLSPQLSHDERIFQALAIGTRDYIRKNGFEKVVIGLSGGIDSSLVAVIACEAIGRENVIGVSMPSKFTSKGTHSDAERLAKNLGIRLIEIPIQKIIKSYLRSLKKEFAGLKSDVAEENIQARIRGNILMAFSNKFSWMVLTTGNKSEIAVGYCTLYGDMSGGFAVIKDVPKVKVYDLARLVNFREKGLIPESILKRAPTAELRKDQKDQDTLPAYEVLDPLLQAYVEEHQSWETMARRHDRTFIKKIMNMVDKSEYKRRQAPPGIKITSRAFGKDWRLPITNKYKEY